MRAVRAPVILALVWLLAFACASTAFAAAPGPVLRGSAVVLPTTSSPSTYQYDATAIATTSFANVGHGVAGGNLGSTGAGPPVVGFGHLLLAAEEGLGGGARFIVDSSGETDIFLNSSEGAVEVSPHAALRITQRGLTLDKVESVIENEQPFQYFHAGQWKTGYYDANSGTFVGVSNGSIRTVIANAKPQYIGNLQAAQP